MNNGIIKSKVNKNSLIFSYNTYSRNYKSYRCDLKHREG